MGFSAIGIGSSVGTLTTLLSNPIESILKVHMLPLDSTCYSVITSEDQFLPKVRSGGCDSTVSTQYHLATKRIVELTYQSRINVSRATGWFSDWTNTNVSIYAPFIGEIPVNNRDVIGHSIYIDYRIDICTGDFIVNLRNEWSTFYVGKGNCSIPVICAASATIQERVLQSLGSLISSGLQLATSAATGNVPGVIGGLASGAQGISQQLQQHISYSQVGGNTGLFDGFYKPYVILRRPVEASGSFTGIIGYVSGFVGDVSYGIPEANQAFLSVIDVDVDGIGAATEAEKNEIKALLKNGIIINAAGGA